MLFHPDVSTLVLPAFAYTNNVFYAYSNRAGYEERDSNQRHYRGNSIIIGPHGDIIVQANHQQDTLLIADCIPGYYGMTHPAVNPNSDLKDRRPRMYELLTASEADFIKGGWKYPLYKNGQEISIESQTPVLEATMTPSPSTPAPTTTHLKSSFYLVPQHSTNFFWVRSTPCMLHYLPD